MFDIKCINCKFFSKTDGCEKGLEDENCNSFSEVLKGDVKGAKPTCSACVWWQSEGCIFDMDNPLTCRRYKSLTEND